MEKRNKKMYNARNKLPQFWIRNNKIKVAHHVQAILEETSSFVPMAKYGHFEEVEVKKYGI